VSAVSVIVVNYRTEDFLPACLESLRKSTSSGDVELILVDNSIRRGAGEILRQHFPDGRLLENVKNLGYARAVNQGISAASSEYIFILNPDTVVEEGALDLLLQFMADHPEAGIVAPKLLNPDGTAQMSSRRFYTLKTIVLRRTLLGKLFKNSAAVRHHLMLDWDHNSTRTVDWVTGAAMLVRRKAISEVGPMDERFFLYFEDVDWCYRMQAAGWKVYYHPPGRVTHHYRRESAKSKFGKAKRAHLASWLRFSEKWSLLLYLLKRNREAISKVVLIAADVLALCVAFYLAYLFRANLRTLLEKPTPAFDVYRSFMVLAVVVGVGAIAYVGLYSKRRMCDWIDLIFEVSKAMVLASVVLMASTFLLYVKIYSRAAVLMFLPISILLLTVERSIFRTVQRRLALTRVNARRVLVVGSGEMAERVKNAILAGARDGLELAGCLDTSDWPANGQNKPALAPERVTLVARAQRAGVVVMADTRYGIAAAKALVSQLSGQGFQVAIASELGELLTEADRIEEMGGLSFLSLRRRPAPGGVLKRSIELLVAVPLIAVYALPLALASLAVAAAGRRPVFVKEYFFGEQNEKIGLVRLNCVSSRGTDRFLQRIGVCWATLLFSVLAGKVALVGLRPEPYQSGREEGHGKPGVFGLWKLATGAEDALRSDSEYLANWSHSLDLKTVIRCVLGGR